jgi:hypothetical protein
MTFKIPGTYRHADWYRYTEVLRTWCLHTNGRTSLNVVKGYGHKDMTIQAAYMALNIK